MFSGRPLQSLRRTVMLRILVGMFGIPFTLGAAFIAFMSATNQRQPEMGWAAGYAVVALAAGAGVLWLFRGESRR